jgi:hypothetical protein
VAVDEAPRGPEIPLDFLGVSLEYGKNGALDSLGHPGSPNHSYLQLLRNLGKGVIRIGGNSQDVACWSPSGMRPTEPGCRLPVSPETLQAIFAASAQIGWPVILGLNLARNDPAAVAELVSKGVLPSIGDGRLLALELGNEPDLFARHMVFSSAGSVPVTARPTTYDLPQSEAEFLAHAGALWAIPTSRPAQPLPLAGPAFCCRWMDRLGAWLQDVSAKAPNRLALATTHHYPLNVCASNRPNNATYGSIPNLLAADTAARWKRAFAAQVSQAAPIGSVLRLAEGNSVACGGAAGVSDTFASAVWALDWLFSLAQAGFSGVNLHGGGKGPYSPVAVSAEPAPTGGWTYADAPRPLYYALLLFAREAEGHRLASATVNSESNVVAWAVTEGRTTRVFVLNKDLRAGGEVLVSTGRPSAHASYQLLQAPSLDSTGRISFQGAALDPVTGKLTPPVPTPIAPDAAGRFRLPLPNASVAVLTY